LGDLGRGEPLATGGLVRKISENFRGGGRTETSGRGRTQFWGEKESLAEGRGPP